MFRTLQLFRQSSSKLTRLPVRASSDITNKFEDQSIRSRRGERCLNQVTLLGRIGGDPLVVGANDNIVKFNLATNDYYRVQAPQEDPDDDPNEEGWRQVTSWHQVVVFRPSLRNSVSRYATRGKRVLVTGRLEYRRYEDPETNKMIQRTSIVADDVVYLSRTEDIDGE
ncbi:single-stranded DNA-binding protein, mitochondrial-like [Amphiura filiformis]|uniref:single-stranded DNA-binding protein, mitochondrial-like n=1 Tax=Amphiura filiformis TaxID=82378 RepID=UPI003B20C532